MTLCDTVVTNLTLTFGKAIEIESVNEGCIIVTPLLRSNFDHVQFYVETVYDKYLISDEGEAVADLFLHGIDVSAEKPIFDAITKIAMSHRIQFRNFVLSAEATEQNLGEASLRLLNAMQATSYLIYKLSARPRSRFVNQVETFLLKHKIHYEAQPVFPGRTSSTNRFSYYVNGNRDIVIDAMSASSPNTARNLAIKGIFKWNDVVQANRPLSFAAIIDNRRGLEVWQESDALSILEGNAAKVVYWTEREEELLPLLSEH